MAITGLKLEATTTHVSKYDADFDKTGKGKHGPNATEWVCGTLDSRIYGRIRDMGTRFTIDPNSPDDDVETSVQASAVNFETVMFGLRGWTKFNDDAGNDIAFKTIKRNHGGRSYEVVDPSLMRLIPSVVIDELAGIIKSSNEVSDQNEKN